MHLNRNSVRNYDPQRIYFQCSNSERTHTQVFTEAVLYRTAWFGFLNWNREDRKYQSYRQLRQFWLFRSMRSKRMPDHLTLLDNASALAVIG